MRSFIKHLDVSDLPAPEPMEKILSILSSSDEQEIICMTHRQKPLNLFKILDDCGFLYRLVEKGNEQSSNGYRVKLYIWNPKNNEAAILIEEDIKSVQ